MLRAMQILSHFYPIPNTAIKVSHFTDGKTEAQRGPLSCPRLTGG